MKKIEVIDFFGNASKTAKAIGISHVAVAKWPDVLPLRISDRVIGAMHRQKIKVPPEWLKVG